MPLFLPQLAPGESQLAVADGVDVEATELGLKTPMKGGTAVVTTSRVVWVAPPSPAGPSAVSVSLHHIADCKLKQLPFGARVFGPSRVRLQLRADLEGRPAGALTSPVRLLKAYLALKSGADRLHQAIVTGLAQLPQSAPGPSGAPGTSGPSPPVSVYERAGSEAVTVDAGALQRLVEMGIERGAAREALIATQGRPLQEAGEASVRRSATTTCNVHACRAKAPSDAFSQLSGSLPTPATGAGHLSCTRPRLPRSCPQRRDRPPWVRAAWAWRACVRGRRSAFGSRARCSRAPWETSTR